MLPRILALALAALLLAAASASADSIVYTKDGNVWLSSPDGAKQYQVTFNGSFSDASQADDGTIVALHLKQFVHLDRSGHLLGNPVDAMGSPYYDGAGDYVGPYEPRVSPDGKRIAYWFYSRADNTLERVATWSYVDHFTDPSSESEFVKASARLV